MGLFLAQGQDEQGKSWLWFVQAFDKYDAEAKIKAVREQKPGYGELSMVPVEAHGSEVLTLRISKGEVITRVRTPDLSYQLADAVPV